MFFERIEPVHEFRHPADDHPDYNESSYYNFACASSGVTGWLRVALQSNQNAAQSTALVFLPSGDTLFAFERTKDPAEHELAAGPIVFEIVVPHEKQILTFDGPTSVLADGRALVDPRSALRSAPSEPTTMRLEVTDLGRPFGTSGEDDSAVLEDTLARGHYEQFIEVTGDIGVGAHTYRVDRARGLRDHSWGPRDWAGPVYYRWVTAALDDGTALMALEVVRRDGRTTRRAAAFADGVTREAELRSLSCDWTEDGFCREVRCEMADGGHDYVLTGTARRPEHFVPLRHRRPGEDGQELRTRIGYAPYDFACTDGRRGQGPIEVLDQLHDGLPAGMTVMRAR